jgi:hypothetical protein
VPLALDVNRIAVRGTGVADIAATRELLLKMIENLAEDEISASRPARPPGRQKRSAGL